MTLPANPTRELPLTLVRYLVLFPAFVLYTTNHEPSIESAPRHLLLTALALLAAHLALQKTRTLVLTRPTPTDALFTTLHLRED